jgi:16S rRNA (cytosine967-C5)-methyltransferase
LQAEEISLQEIPSVSTGLTLTERKNVFITQAYQKGFFEVQDGSSQLVAHFMKLQPSLRVVDACAGAGGKSLHIAALLKNKGKVISMDIEERKLLELKKRAARAKVDIIETKVIEGSKTIKRLGESADRVLLDVPCSGLGVLKRNPDSKWKLTYEKYQSLLQVQREILGQYSNMTKKGGYLIYSTCSLLPSENREQIQWFLEQNPKGWELEDQKEVYPSSSGYDGFFMARLKRL